MFALTALLGFRFAPCLRDALSRHLYLVDEVGTSESLNSLLFGQVKSKLIIEQWDEMRRVASSIRHGTMSASLIMRKLAAYPRQNQVSRALPSLDWITLLLLRLPSWEPLCVREQKAAMSYAVSYIR